ncbi:hypothetical protein LCGC14_3009600 [marine sediment metagenome]|uniref:Uncharacterized protein n=1 Tax=marine sediment metagenome TaxID=412755 RepID=A0A0F8WYJ5_9ZZZZ|nr:hypothetical protein [Phycisphaerales bacterium]
MKKGQIKNVLFCIVVIILLCWLLTMAGGCSGQRYRKYVVDDTGALVKVIDIDTWCILREFSSKGSSLVITSGRYDLTMGDHQSKTSAGKLKATHPTGIGIEFKTE